MKICMISLGCDKNLVDSEMMLGYLRRDDVSLTDEQAEADVIIVNTCAFILDAKDETIQTMLTAARYKEEGQLKALIMTGCMAERYKDEVLREIPEIDAVVGTSAYDKISAVLERVLAGEKVTEFEDLNRLPVIGTETRRVRTSLAAYGYLKIAEGCDKHCTYCIIPSLRGAYRSYPMEALVNEAARMAEEGVKELILVAQETTRYGMDLYGEKRLPELLRRLCQIEDIRWIRILYCYPEEITDELIQIMAEEKKICHYLDLPIQHASDPILKRMGRRTSRRDLEEIIGKLRAAMPDIALRTTLISGFPGETEEDQDCVLDFVERIHFDRLGVFPYSQEEDTPALNLVPLMALRRAICRIRCRKKSRKRVEMRLWNCNSGFPAIICSTRSALCSMSLSKAISRRTMSISDAPIWMPPMWTAISFSRETELN